ncbi:hypothetical protein ACFQBQ_14080 [Granulicella cerasi]|uniref:Uncharacterized protein n=1 Tax=Granulicella cerasi TaxID=741063 RepID=A0ABW1ZB45_9BACT|nr:hypothetical protein [Granulicella cerasi]
MATFSATPRYACDMRIACTVAALIVAASTLSAQAQLSEKTAQQIAEIAQ